MSREDTYLSVVNILVGQLSASADLVKPDSKVVEELGVDSADSVELRMKFEDEFHVEITAEEAQKLLTVNNIVDLIVSKSPK